MIARGLLGILCALQTAATLVIDFNHTHATNPEWTGHARFHLVWQNMTAFLLGVVALALLFWGHPSSNRRFYLAAALTCLPMLGFSAAFVGRRMYGGTLSDPNGIPPARLLVFGKVREIDMNLFAVLAGLLVFCVSLKLYTS